MRKFVLALGAAATLATSFVGASATSASADPYYGRHHGGYHGGYRGHRYYRHHRGGHGDALAAGAIGLGVGALLGGAIASRPAYEDRYYDGGYYEPAYRYRTYDRRPILEGPVVLEGRVGRPVYRESYGYSHEAACAARYRTYDPQSDTFIGKGGVTRRCRL